MIFVDHDILVQMYNPTGFPPESRRGYLFFSSILFFLISYSIIFIFNFLKIFPAELEANVDARAHQGAEVETCGVLIAKLLHAPNPLYLFRQS